MAMADGISGAIDGLARQGGAIIGIVRDAAARTGVDFSYLLAQAKIESGLDPRAQARGSSARGLYQFTDATWLETVRKHGADHGMGWAADAIRAGGARAGSAARTTILALRDNAEAATLMAGEFAGDNATALGRRLGRSIGSTDLYMAHFLGAAGAGRFLSAMAATPGLAAASVVPLAAAANHSVFFGKDGTPRSLAEVFGRFAAKLEASPPPPPPRPFPPAEAVPARGGTAVPAGGSALPAVDAGRARLAYLLLAGLGG